MTMYETRDPYAIKAAVVEEISIASSGDEFLDILNRQLRDAEAHAEKATAVARKAEQDQARADGRLYAVRASVEAYREAMSRGRSVAHPEADR